MEPIARVAPDVPARLWLTAGDGPDVVLAALALGKRGATLRDAKRALEAACAGTEAVSALPTVEDAGFRVAFLPSP